MEPTDAPLSRDRAIKAQMELIQGLMARAKELNLENLRLSAEIDAALAELHRLNLPPA